MNISKITYTSPYFKSSGRTLYKDRRNGKITTSPNVVSSDDYRVLNSNYTHFYRNDLDYRNKRNWKPFIKAIDEAFKNTDKVNVYDFACSDGSEAYSLSMSLMEEVEDYDKFFPIKAYDSDNLIILQAKSGKIDCDKEDVKAIELNTSNKSYEYFRINYVENRNFPIELKIKEPLKDKVIFEPGSIQSKIDEIEPSNSLVLCRNFLPYLNSDERYEVVSKLAQKLDETSVLVIGGIDFSLGMISILQKNGFKQISKNAFQKQ